MDEDRTYWFDRLTKYFKAKNPKQANKADIDKILDKYDKGQNGGFEKMWDVLREKYGFEEAAMGNGELFGGGAPDSPAVKKPPKPPAQAGPPRPGLALPGTPGAVDPLADDEPSPSVRRPDISFTAPKKISENDIQLPKPQMKPSVPPPVARAPVPAPTPNPPAPVPQPAPAPAPAPGQPPAPAPAPAPAPGQAPPAPAPAPGQPPPAPAPGQPPVPVPGQAPPAPAPGQPPVPVPGQAPPAPAPGQPPIPVPGQAPAPVPAALQGGPPPVSGVPAAAISYPPPPPPGDPTEYQYWYDRFKAVYLEKAPESATDEKLREVLQKSEKFGYMKTFDMLVKKYSDVPASPATAPTPAPVGKRLPHMPFVRPKVTVPFTPPPGVFTNRFMIARGEIRFSGIESLMYQTAAPHQRQAFREAVELDISENINVEKACVRINQVYGPPGSLSLGFELELREGVDCRGLSEKLAVRIMHGIFTTSHTRRSYQRDLQGDSSRLVVEGSAIVGGMATPSAMSGQYLTLTKTLPTPKMYEQPLQHHLRPNQQHSPAPTYHLHPAHSPSPSRHHPTYHSHSPDHDLIQPIHNPNYNSPSPRRNYAFGVGSPPPVPRMRPEYPPYTYTDSPPPSRNVTEDQLYVQGIMKQLKNPYNSVNRNQHIDPQSLSRFSPPGHTLKNMPDPYHQSPNEIVDRFFTSPPPPRPQHFPTPQLRGGLPVPRSATPKRGGGYGSQGGNQNYLQDLLHALDM